MRLFLYNILRKLIKYSTGTRLTTAIPIVVSSLMECCWLPIELCEAVMDALQDYYEPLGRPGVLLESKRTWESQQALCACSLTCRAWHVRAQHLLWTLPHVLDSQHLAQFTSAVRNLSSISTAGLVLGDQRAYAIKTFDPSMVSSLFMHSFDHLRHLLFYGFLFHRGPPLAILRMRLPFFASITVLQLLDCAFQSLRALLDVVWACPSLATLAISRSGIKSKRTSGAGLRLLSAAVENLRACRKLTSLYLDAFTVQVRSYCPPFILRPLTICRLHRESGIALVPDSVVEAACSGVL